MPKFTEFTATQLEAAIADLSGKSTARAARHLSRAKNALAKLQSSTAPSVLNHSVTLEAGAEQFGLSVASAQLLTDLLNDTHNWSGTPLFGGNVGGDKASCGNLTDLKKKGFVHTTQDEENRKCQWVTFTSLAVEFAELMGIDFDRGGVR